MAGPSQTGVAKVLGALMEGVSTGLQALPLFSAAVAAIRAMTQDNRPEPTLEELETIAGRISDRQDRIDQA